MWPKEYQDYKIDSPLIKEPVETGHGIVGCEMHELNGWGHSFQISPKEKRRGALASFLTRLIS
jgi:hypothetical protein